MDIFRRHRNFILILLFWTLSGMYLGPLIYGIIPLTIIAFKSRNQFEEMLLGFFYILILSDSRQDSLEFAINAKNIYIVMMALYIFMDRKNFIPLNQMYKTYIPFFVIAFVCVLNSPSDIIGTSIEKTTSYFLLILVVPNYVMRCYRDKGEAFFKTLIYFGATILAMGFIMRFINPYQTLLEGRYRGLLGNPNGLGIFSLIFFLLVSLLTNFYPKLLTRNERVVVYALIMLSMLLCGSRSSLFAIVIYIFFSYFYRFSPFLGFLAFLIFAGTYQYVTDNIVSIIDSLGLTSYLRSDTIKEASGRFFAWRFAWNNITQSVYIGHGFEYTNYLFEANKKYLSDLGHQGNAHNSYITLWLDTGLFGLLSYLFAFISMFIRAARKTRLAIPLLYAVVFCTFFESWLTASLNPFTIQLFIILSILTSESILPQKAEVAVPVQ